MKKIMSLFKNKSLLGLTLSLSLCISLSSCWEDNHPLPMYSSLGTVTSTEPILIDSDSYGNIRPTNPSIVTAEKADSIGQRVLINLYLDADRPSASNQDVKLIGVYKVLTKEASDLRISDSPSEDSFGNSPIQVTGASISKEHLNIQFNTLGNDEQIPHRINLLLTKDTRIDEEGYLRLYLRHDANGDLQNTIYWGITSFPLSSIPDFSKSTCRGIKIYYNSGANPNVMWRTDTRIKESDQSAFLRMMESSQEISNEHALLTCQLQ